MSDWTIDVKLAWHELRRSRATAKALKWSTKLMEAQIAIVDALPDDHPRRAREKDQLREFMRVSEQVRGVVPKRTRRPS